MMGFTETLTLAFVVCKLSGLLDLSWWVILLPELFAAVFYVVLFMSVMWVRTPVRRKKEKRRN